MWDDLYGSDDEAAILDYMFMQKRKKKPSAANRPKKIKVPRATKADVELRQLLATADRATLEQLIYDMAHEKKGRSVESLLETLGGGKSKVQEVQAHNEVLADMGLFNSVSRDNLIEIMAYLPDIKDRLNFAFEMCKTWRVWLKGHPVLYENIALTFHKSYGSRWCDGNGLLRLISSAPEGTIRRFSLGVDDKAPGFNRKTHVEGIFNLGKQFSRLTHLTLSGGKITSEVVSKIADTCSATLQEIKLWNMANDYNRQVTHKVLRSSPHLRSLQLSISDDHDLNCIREAIVASRAGTPPLLETLCDEGFEWSFRHKSLGTVMTLFNSLVKLKKLKMRVTIPKTEEALEVAMRGLAGPYPEAEDITLILGPQGLALRDMSPGLQAFFSRLPTVFPNLRSLALERKREFISQKNIRRGHSHQPAPVLSGHHLFPHLETLRLSYFDIADDFVIDGPCLSKAIISTPDDRPSTPIINRLKATCPQLADWEPKKLPFGLW